MVSDNPVDPVRAKVIHMFSAQGKSSDTPDTELSESLLLCDGGYRGRQFARGNQTAIWSPHSRTLTLYEDGQETNQLSLAGDDA